MFCNYCNKKAKLVSGKIIYPHRTDLKEKLFWLCKDCKAYVGCHGKTNKPLGVLANKKLRSLRMLAHKAFDEVWKSKSMRRSNAYQLLAVRLNIPHEDCHIGMFNEDLCNKTIETATSLTEKEN